MKLSHALLAVLLFVRSVNALKCYTCKEKSCKWNELKECGAGEMCVIREQVQSHSPSTIVTRHFMRGCLSHCTNISFDLGSINVNVNCCSSDFCNHEIEQTRSSLQCHGCLDLGNDFECRQPGSVTCQSTQSKCAEIHTSLPSSQSSGEGKADQSRAVNLRGCVSASFCSPDRVYEMLEVEGNISCCDHNLCNRSGLTARLTPLHPTLLLLLLLPIVL